MLQPSSKGAPFASVHSYSSFPVSSYLSSDLGPAKTRRPSDLPCIGARLTWFHRFSDTRQAPLADASLGECQSRHTYNFSVFARCSAGYLQDCDKTNPEAVNIDSYRTQHGPKNRSKNRTQTLKKQVYPTAIELRKLQAREIEPCRVDHLQVTHPPVNGKYSLGESGLDELPRYMRWTVSHHKGRLAAWARYRSIRRKNLKWLTHSCEANRNST